MPMSAKHGGCWGMSRRGRLRKACGGLLCGCGGGKFLAFLLGRRGAARGERYNPGADETPCCVPPPPALYLSPPAPDGQQRCPAPANVDRVPTPPARPLGNHSRCHRHRRAERSGKLCETAASASEHPLTKTARRPYPSNPAAYRLRSGSTEILPFPP